jgi:predicted kinase
MKPVLFLLLGYPGSGKSTFARQLSAQTNSIRLNSDELRDYMYGHRPEVHDPKNNPAVFGALDYMAAQLLAAGQSVLYDANNNRYREREKHQKLAAEHGAVTVVLWVNTPLDIAKQRELQRRQDPNHLAIPDALYNRIAGALEEPRTTERAIIVDGQTAFADQLQAFTVQLADLGL